MRNAIKVLQNFYSFLFQKLVSFSTNVAKNENASLETFLYFIFNMSDFHELNLRRCTEIGSRWWGPCFFALYFDGGSLGYEMGDPYFMFY